MPDSEISRRIRSRKARGWIPSDKLRKRVLFGIPVLLMSIVFILLALLSGKDSLLRGLWIGLAVAVFAYLVIALLESIYDINALEEFLQHRFDEVEKRFGLADELRKQGLKHFYKKRSRVPWNAFSERASRRYWVCGTSLQSLVNQDIPTGKSLLASMIERNIEDMRIILPSTSDTDDNSYRQLHYYDQHYLEQSPQPQVAMAERVLKAIRSLLNKKNKCVKVYQGIMFENITIYDDTAIISFYNVTGFGDGNLTLVFEGKDTDGYKYAEAEFKEMWDKSVVPA